MNRYTKLNKIFQLRNKVNGLWWGGIRGWSKKPKVYIKLADLRKAISYHKDAWIKLNKISDKTVIELEITDFILKKHSTTPIDMEK